MAWFVETEENWACTIRSTKIKEFIIKRDPEDEPEHWTKIIFWLDESIPAYETNPFNYTGELKPLIASIIEMCHDPSPTVYTVQGLLKLAEKHKKTLQKI